MLVEIKKRLLLCNVLTAELSVVIDNNKKDLNSLQQFVSGNLFEKVVFFLERDDNSRVMPG